MNSPYSGLRYVESVQLLVDSAEGVPEDAIPKFLKTTLVEAAHGALDNKTTVALALQELQSKFAIMYPVEIKTNIYL